MSEAYTLHDYLKAQATRLVDTQRPELEGDELAKEIEHVTDLLIQMQFPELADPA